MTRLAVIADIHGNAVALDAVRADLEAAGADAVICLGDAIQGGPEPARVVATLRRMDCPVVMGNADDWLLTGVSVEAEAESAERRRQLELVREWSLAQLSPSDRAFIAGFRPTVEVPLGARRVLGFHGSPASFDEILLPHTPRETFERALLPYADRILCGGHVHLPFLRRIRDSVHFNPGSVGMATAHDQEPADASRFDPWAEYALLGADGGSVSLEFRRVPFDVGALERAYRDSGHPLAERHLAHYAGRS